MKIKPYTALIISITLCAMLAACTKKNSGQNLDGRVYRGVMKAMLDSTILVDSATNSFARTIVDSTYEQFIYISANTATVTFTFAKSTYTEHLLNSAYTFNANDGHFSVAPNGLPGRAYSFRFSNDSLIFTYNDGYTIGAGEGFVSKFADFAGVRIQ